MEDSFRLRATTIFPEKILILFSKRLNEKRVVIFCPKIPCDDLSGGTRVLWPNVKDLTRDKL